MEYQLRTVNSGLVFEPVIPGLVPEIEEREACRFNGYTWHDWHDLPKEERVDAVAHFRLIKLIDMHQADASQRQQRAEMDMAQARQQSRRGDN